MECRRERKVHRCSISVYCRVRFHFGYFRVSDGDSNRSEEAELELRDIFAQKFDNFRQTKWDAFIWARRSDSKKCISSLVLFLLIYSKSAKLFIDGNVMRKRAEQSGNTTNATRSESGRDGSGRLFDNLFSNFYGSAKAFLRVQFVLLS